MTTTAEYLRGLRAAKPLVYHITNVVTVSDCANATLLVGGLPVMANSPREAEAMMELAQALVLNIGTLHEEQVEAMLLAGRRANARGRPVILDPVGAGATAYRTETAQQLLQQLDVTVVKGNAGEIATLAGEQAEVRGVESGVVNDVISPARALSHGTGAVVAVTGARDVVVHGTGAGWAEGGSPRMSTFVGSGCVAASLVGCFVGAHPETPFEATLAALRPYRAAAARAAAANPAGPVAYRDAVWNQLALLQPEDLETE
jgi:hydroxyethylthiazole kinase